MTKLSPLQEEISQAVLIATAPMAREIANLRSEIAALREGEVSDWMTVKEVAEYLNVKDQTIRRRVHRGLYETRRDGGKAILIRRTCILGEVTHRRTPRS